MKQEKNTNLRHNAYVIFLESKLDKQAAKIYSKKTIQILVRLF